MNRARLVAEALEWDGTPFEWQQATKGLGCDCKGLIVGIARECGLPEAESVHALEMGDHRGHVPTGALRKGLADLFDKVDEAQPSDILLVFMKGKAQHLAMYLGGGRMMHCHLRMRKPHTVNEQVRWADVDSIWRWRGADT